MKLSRLKINNFRSIKSLDISLPQICALVGPNNAGKSNILLAIQRVIGKDWVSVTSFSEEDVYCRDPSADISIALSFEPALPYAKFKAADPVEIATFSFEYTRYQVGDQKRGATIRTEMLRYPREGTHGSHKGSKERRIASVRAPRQYPA